MPIPLSSHSVSLRPSTDPLSEVVRQHLTKNGNAANDGS
jgi:hypothetical protein